MLTRRAFGEALLGSLGLMGLPSAGQGSPAGTRIDSLIGGVRIGAITYSFRDQPPLPDEDFLGVGLRGCRDCRLGIAELWTNMVQPKSILPGAGQYDFGPDTPQMRQAREVMRQWRITTPRSFWSGVRDRFRSSGIELFAYSLTLGDDFSDQEIDRIFEAMKAMGVRILGTNQTRVAMARRVVPFAEKHNVLLAFHNHSHIDKPNEIASLESYETVLAMSKNYRANLDVGHFVAGNNDPIAFIERHHERITHLHLKDRKRDDGPNMPWGQGDTPIADILQLVQKKRYPIPCLIEYEYKGTRTPIEEVGSCVDYIRRALT